MAASVSNEPKTVILIRHGQSEYNKARKAAHFQGDPLLFDAPLSSVGREEAIALGERLRASGHCFDTIITSPLTRAIETSLLVFGAGCVSSLLVTDLAREALRGNCDVGRDRDELAVDFPALAGHVAHLPRQWWGGSYAAEYVQRGGLPQSEHEREDAVRARLWRLHGLVAALPARRIAIVGHGTAFQQLVGVQLRNCEHREWDVAGGLAWCTCRNTDRCVCAAKD